MTVFISHKNTDELQARRIDAQLKAAGIATYLDVLDPKSKSTSDITSVITDRIIECSHLIAIVSDNTKESWWVPFEIGGATVHNKRICTYAISAEQLPDYLKKWPILKSENAISTFIKNYKSDTKLTRDLESVSNESFEKGNLHNPADHFHANLKRELGQY